ncbi:MAG: hypothetical protein UT02_C0003G0016 [Parcubacteria group bacterium GW2011_GWC2_38_7]|nr:MAG: hypothetical protein UT02_C0003G0016 [Parcubacteria group bacterium GW2011_GWC2_38_7]
MFRPKFEFGSTEEHDQKLTQLLREKGPDNPIVSELLNNMAIEQEALLETSGDQVALIRFNLRLARIYFSAGYKDVALLEFDDALTLAEETHNQALAGAIKQEIEQLRS